MFNLFSRKRQSRPPHLTHPQHYDQTSRQAPGEKYEMSLVQAALDGPAVTLVYRWSPNLSDDEADRLDTRARAYIACAIYDAAITAGLSCQPGPPHGQRPSWHIIGEKGPVSLINAGFDVSDKTCFMQIGAGIMMLSGPQSSGRYTKKLISGFRAQFGRIKV